MRGNVVRRHLAFVAAGIAVTVALAGCGNLSSETQAKGKEAVCASADASVSSLKAGGSGAKATASLIYDLVDDATVKDAAAKVRDGDADKKAVDTLVSWVGEAC